MTTERPTPEVDAFLGKAFPWTLPKDHEAMEAFMLIGSFARQLERQRDEAREHEGYVPEFELDDALRRVGQERKEYEPIGWIATHTNGTMYHFSKHDGWNIEVVTEEQIEPNNNNNRHREHNISER